MKIILTVFIIAINIIFQPISLWAEELSAKSISEDIKVLGPKKVCRALFKDRHKWNILLKNIASGNSEWLKIAVSLREGSDAHASETLNLAVGEALEHNPENVFKFTLDVFKLSYICGGPDVDDVRYDSYELSTEAINKRIQKVSLIKDKNLQNKLNKCLQHLTESKKHIARFYQIDK